MITKEEILEDLEKRGKLNEDGTLSLVGINDEIRITKVNQFEKAITIFMNKLDLAKQFLEIQPLYYDQSRIWWMWNGVKLSWKQIDETDILNCISNHSSANTIKANERSEILEALKQESRRNAPLPTKKTWIQFKNKIIDVQTNETFPATSRYFSTNPIPYELGESEETPVMDKIFEEWVGKDYVQTLYEIIAYCLIPDYPIHRIFCFIGGGMNGKSCFLNLLRKFIGINNCCSTELDVLLVSRFEVSTLHKKLICQMGETNFNEMNKTSILKKLSGGDLIGYEYKNKDHFQDINYAKIIISTNNLPTTSDKTIGFYRRWMIIDFPNQFNESIDILSTIPEQEYQNLSLKCVNILKDLLVKREFTNEGSIEERIQRYEDKSNFLNKFIKEYCITDETSFVTKASFYKKFIQWCKENKHRELSEKSLSSLVLKTSLESSKDYIDWHENGRLTKKQVRSWRGIRWKTTD